MAYSTTVVRRLYATFFSCIYLHNSDGLHSHYIDQPYYLLARCAKWRVFLIHSAPKPRNTRCVYSIQCTCTDMCTVNTVCTFYITLCTLLVFYVHTQLWSLFWFPICILPWVVNYLYTSYRLYTECGSVPTQVV